MGRTLPWKKGESALAVKKSASTRGSPRPTGNASRLSSVRSISHPAPATPTSRPNAKQGSSSRAQTSARSPSSSPPPDPIPESFMVDGFDDDDQWRMVEDEFYAVAGHFTAHLHAAQYRRLKEEAKKQNANIIPTISRPFTAPPTSHVKRRQAALALAAAQRKGVKTVLSRINGAETEDEDDEIPWKGTHLAGLMNSPRKKAQPLPNMTSTLGGTRAAALGLHRDGIASSSTSKAAFPSHHKNPFLARNTSNVTRPRMTSQRYQGLDEGDDDDDLERYSSRQPSTHKHFPRTQPGTAKVEVSRSSQPRSAASPTGIGSASKEISTSKPSQVSRSSSATILPVSNENDSDSGQETYFQRRMRERRGRRKSSRNKSSTPDEPGKEESQPNQQKSQDSQNAILIVPSF